MAHRFTLQTNSWYTMEFNMAGDGNLERWVSAVKVHSVTPKGSGAGIFDLSFYHANYPAGVRDKVYSLRTLLRTEAYIIAQRLENEDRGMSVMLFDLQPEWLKRFYNIEERTMEEAVRKLESIAFKAW